MAVQLLWYDRQDCVTPMMKLLYGSCLLLLTGAASSNALFEDVSNHRAWAVLDTYECGYSAADRIIGGQNAALGQFPWIVRLGYVVDGDDEIEWMCGGVLVTDRHVLTAAHCLDTASDEYKLASLRIGEHNTDTDPDCELGVCAPPVQTRGVKTIKSHPSFNQPEFHNDIAIIVLDKPVDLNEYVTPICLPRGEQMRELSVGEYTIAAGWGKTNMTTDERATVLQFVALPIVPTDDCLFFGKWFKMGPEQICAGGKMNKDACGGDSGGPLMKIFDTIEGPKNFLVGVVSFGPTVCGIKRPAVYTSVPYFMKWILDSIMES